MLMMNGLAGLNGPESCGANQKWDPNAMYAGATQRGFCVPIDAPLTPAEETPWWSTLATSVATGAAQGLVHPNATPAMYTPPTPTAWYATPLGMGGIAAGLILLVVLLKK